AGPPAATAATARTKTNAARRLPLRMATGSVRNREVFERRGKRRVVGDATNLRRRRRILRPPRVAAVLGNFHREPAEAVRLRRQRRVLGVPQDEILLVLGGDVIAVEVPAVDELQLCLLAGRVAQPQLDREDAILALALRDLADDAAEVR